MFRWRGTVPLLVAAVVFGLFFSYQFAVAMVQASNLGTYENKELGFSLKVPKSWNDNYEVKVVEKNEDGYKALLFFEKRYHYPILQIAIIPESEYGSYAKTLYSNLGEQDGLIYGAMVSPETLFLTDKDGNKQEVTYITEMLSDIQEALRNKEYTIIKPGS
jgi:hypothetical protein